MIRARYRIEPLSRAHRVDAFKCNRIGRGVYLEAYAMADVERAACACFVMSDAIGGRIVGFYTLWPVVIQFEGIMPGAIKRIGDHRSAPALLIKQLSVDMEFAGEQLEHVLAIDAIRRASRPELGAMALGLEVFEIDEDALYAPLGFKDFESEYLWRFLDVPRHDFWEKTPPRRRSSAGRSKKV